MKTIYRIAKTELYTMFYSPVAWVVLVIFSIQSNWKFFDSLERFEKSQKMGDGMGNLSQAIFQVSWDYIPKCRIIYIYMFRY